MPTCFELFKNNLTIMRLVSIEDFRDIYLKTIQRGVRFILSKVSLDNTKRTKSSFNETNISSANWWIIPEIRARWNKMITGNSEMTYEEYMSSTVFSGESSLKMLSIGSGVCTHELSLAELNPHWDILCIDFSNNLIETAKANAQARGLKNVQFVAANIYEYQLPDNFFDVVFFHQSLHHFARIDEFIPHKVMKTLNGNGKLVINEYVGPSRLQYPQKQLKAISRCIQLTDKPYRRMYKSHLYKTNFYGSGLLRMIVSDPSECIDSAAILPTIHKHFNTVYEKPFGGNILMCALKDIAHHYVEMDPQKSENLQRMMDFEDQYLLRNKSDFLFGIYQKR
jgi:ubiquinone/menaquinone biosynthesis C-methylase UbiE